MLAMPSDGNRVIRIPRSDDPGAFVLVYTAPAGRQALKLIGTEGESPYVVSIRKSHIKELRSKNFQGSDEDFEDILASVLKHRFDSDNDNEDDANSIESVPAGGIEASASIKQARDRANQLVITIRKHIDTITQRVASISLTQDDDQTIELFEWTGLMVTRADSLAQQITSLTERLHAAEESIKSLNSSISELVAGKKEHEDLLLTNFVQVLNEKKLKIRNQQRLLAAASVDEDKLSELKAASRPRHAEPKSRRGKRKPTEEPSDSDEFERMDVDQGAIDDQKDEEDEEDAGTEDLDGTETPQPLEEETESEAEEARSEETSSQKDDDKKDTRPQLAQPSEPPPRRDLPFLRNTAASKPRAQGDEDDGGETDDDEL